LLKSAAKFFIHLITSNSCKTELNSNPISGDSSHVFVQLLPILASLLLLTTSTTAKAQPLHP
jgi:hypothetical protein